MPLDEVPINDNSPALVHPFTWWSQKGWKVVIQDFQPQVRKLKLGNENVAVLSITPLSGHGDETWLLEWSILHAKRGEGVDDVDEGKRVFTDEELKEAFAAKHGAVRENDTVRSQGKFWRAGRYLVIPGPAWAEQGMSVLSIEVQDEIRNAVRELLRS